MKLLIELGLNESQISSLEIWTLGKRTHNKHHGPVAKFLKKEEESVRL